MRKWLKFVLRSAGKFLFAVVQGWVQVVQERALVTRRLLISISYVSQVVLGVYERCPFKLSGSSVVIVMPMAGQMPS